MKRYIFALGLIMFLCVPTSILWLQRPGSTISISAIAWTFAFIVISILAGYVVFLRRKLVDQKVVVPPQRKPRPRQAQPIGKAPVINNIVRQNTPETRESVAEDEPAEELPKVSADDNETFVDYFHRNQQ